MSHRELSDQVSLSDYFMGDHALLYPLDGLEEVIDWDSLVGICGGIYNKKRGRPCSIQGLFLF